MKQSDIEALEQKLEYRFTNKQLLITALTHKTYAFEAATPVEFNERLEFLGDSILSFVAAEQLYQSNKYFSEGELTRRRSQYVNNKLLADVAISLDLGAFLLLGKGEKKQDGARNKSNLANAFEAIIGAVYLDSDLKTAQGFIVKRIFEKIPIL
jgi:ribonuclease III